MSYIAQTEKLFWEQFKSAAKPSQLERYEAKNAPEYIKKFIALGGGGKMGTTTEEFARFKFSCLEKRSKGKDQTGYDHKVTLESGKTIYIEQKSSGHWGENEFKWQHIADDHMWNVLLLCGIGYERVRFWTMNRPTFDRLKIEGKITNQGNKEENSTQGVWFNYSTVKADLVEVTSNEELLNFITA
jgi:hypothetical protein